MAGIGKEHPELNWYYLYLPNKELKRYIGVFSGRKSVKLRKPSGEAEERYFCFKVFSFPIPANGVTPLFDPWSETEAIELQSRT